MNMFARFDENPAMTLQDIKETKHYIRTQGQRENSIPTTNLKIQQWLFKILRKQNIADGPCENSIPSNTHHKQSLRGV